MNKKNNYEDDFYVWSMEQAQLLKKKQVTKTTFEYYVFGDNRIDISLRKN